MDQKEYEWVMKFIEEMSVKYAPVIQIESELLNLLFIVNLN